MGDTYGGYTPPPVYEVCNPLDSACAARNNALNEQFNQTAADAVNAQHLADCLHGQYAPSLCYATFGGVPPADPERSDGRTQWGSGLVATPGSTIDTGSGSVFIPLPDKSDSSKPTAPPAASSVPPPAVPVVPIVPQAAAGAVAGSSSSAVVNTPPSSGFDLSEIPVWGWAVGAAVALYLFGGGFSGR